MKKILMPFLIFSYLFANDPGSDKNYMGMNIGGVHDWSGNIIFADAMKSAREWCYPDNTWTTLPSASLDAQGWPLVDAELIVWHGLIRDNSGTYYLSFESNAAAAVTVRLASGNVDNVLYNQSTNTTTASIILTNPDDNALCLRFTGTGGGVRNVKLMRPVSPGSSTSHSLDDDFSQPFLQAISPFHALRFMDYLGGYSNKQVHWSDRVQPDFASFNRDAPDYSWLGKGGPWEYIIRLCNQTQKDAWICIPLLVDDEYIHKVAQLFRDGNSFTENAGLNPNSKLYVEYGNELWNTAGQFDGNLNHDLAAAEYANGDPYHYAYDGNDNDWYWAMRRVARRALDISRIFREEFGNAEMMFHVRPLYEWQLGYTDRGVDPLNYLEEAYIPLVNPGRTIDYFFYGGGGSAYYNPDNSSDNLSLDNIWDDGSMNENVWGSGVIATDANICATFGIKRIAYEGGASFDNTGHSEEVKAQAWTDERMGSETTSHHNVWSEWGGDLLTYYTLRPNDYQWGFMTSIDDLTLPKYQATASLAQMDRSPIKHFKPIPGVVDGIKFDLSFPTWKDSLSSWYSDIQDGEWRSYIFSVEQGGTFNIAAEYINGSGSRVSMISDGNIASEKIITGTGSDNFIVNWPKGMHSVRIKSIGGNVTIKSLQTTIISTDAKKNNNFPISCQLFQNYPNPFNPNTVIRYSVPAVGTTFMNSVILKIYDILGREITTLVNEQKPSGTYSVEWNGTNSAGKQVGSGVYFYQLKTDASAGSATGLVETKKMIFLK